LEKGKGKKESKGWKEEEGKRVKKKGRKRVGGGGRKDRSKRERWKENNNNLSDNKVIFKKNLGCMDEIDLAFVTRSNSWKELHKMTLTKRDEIEIDHICVQLIASENGWKWISWIKNDKIDQIRNMG
jgi:hypothetical protein